MSRNPAKPASSGTSQPTASRYSLRSKGTAEAAKLNLDESDSADSRALKVQDVDLLSMDPKEKSLLDKVDSLSLPSYENEDETELVDDQSENIGKNLLAIQEQKTQDMPSSSALKPTQLQKDTDIATKKVKEQIEMERAQRAKESQFSPEQLENIKRIRDFVDTLKAIMVGMGEPASEEEISECVSIFLTDPDQHIGFYPWFIRGMRKGALLHGNKNETTYNKLNETHGNTLKNYQSLLKDFQRLYQNITTVLYGAQKVQTPFAPKPQSSGQTSFLLPKRAEDPNALPPLNIEGQISSSVQFQPLKRPRESSFTYKEPELKKKEFNPQTAFDYCKELRTTVPRMIKSVGGFIDDLDIFEICKTHGLEEWKKASSDYKEMNRIKTDVVSKLKSVNQIKKDKKEGEEKNKGEEAPKV